MDMKLMILVLVIETVTVFGKPTDVENEGKMAMTSQHCTKKTQETQRNPD